ncbi:MAG: hypothetical protein ACOX7B_08005 [Christensenellales bacterium]|jgi:hypothetical protein
MAGKVSREELAIAALVAQPNIKAASKVCGVAEKTLHAWLNQPGFSAKVREAQLQISRTTMGRLLSTITLAVDTLIEVMSDRKASSTSRVTAAKALLDHSLKVYEIEAVQNRLDALEEQLHG